jgi:hypothetical protein
MADAPLTANASLTAARKPSDVADATEQKFHRLAGQWKANRGPTSSVTKIANDPAYREIIEMGKPALPFILAALEAEPDFWFAALRRITGENPITPAIQGDLHAITEAWLRWARANHVRW